MKITESDYYGDNSLDCPRCNVPIDEQYFHEIEPDVGDHEMTCPHCSKKIAVRCEVVCHYKARSA